MLVSLTVRLRKWGGGEGRGGGKNSSFCEMLVFEALEFVMSA